MTEGMRAKKSLFGESITLKIRQYELLNIMLDINFVTKRCGLSMMGVTVLSAML